MKKILYFAFAALALFAVSCAKVTVSDEGHKAGEPDVTGCYDVFFPTQEASGSHVYDPSADPSVTILVSRTNTKGTISVPYNLITDDDVFEGGVLAFEDGQSESTVTIDFSKSTTGVKYAFTIALEGDQYVSKYSEGAKSLDFDVMRVEWKWFCKPGTEEPATVTFTQDWWGETATGKIKYYEVDGVRYCQTVTDPTHYYKGEAYTGYGFLGTGKTAEDAIEWTFKWYTKDQNSEGNDIVQLDYQLSGYYSSTYASDVYVVDWYSYWTIVKPQTSLEGVDYLTFVKKYESSYPAAYYDGNGGFYIYTAYYWMTGIGGWSEDAYDVIGIAEGFDRRNYDVKEIETDYTVDGVIPVYVSTGKTASAIKYDCAEGQLTATQAGNIAKAIIEGTSTTAKEFKDLVLDEEEGVKIASLGLEFDKTGYYTFVVVTEDEDGKCTENYDYTSFYYVSKEDTEEHAVKISVNTEAVPARFDQTVYTPYNSFAYYLNGEDLEEVHLAIFAAKTYEAYPEACNALVKTTAAYALSDEAVAQIQEPGGYETICSGCKDNTAYYVVVWATNGDLDTTINAYWMVPKTPEKWTYLGEGLYTDDICVTEYFSNPSTVKCDVYQSEDDPGRIKMANFSCRVATAGFVQAGYSITEEEMAEYKGTFWDDAEVIFNVTDPEAVYFEEQDFGVCFNAGDGFISATNLYQGTYFSKGQFADNVISFPKVKGILVAFGGHGYYYANYNGATKLELPDAETGMVAASTSVVTSPVYGKPENVKFHAEFFERKQNPVFTHDGQNVEFRAKTIDNNRPAKKASSRYDAPSNSNVSFE